VPIEEEVEEEVSQVHIGTFFLTSIMATTGVRYLKLFLVFIVVAACIFFFGRPTFL
jgi:hypothetical protein